MVSHHLDNTADYLKTLGQHSQLIAQLYHQGTTVDEQDIDNPRLMNLLIQQRIFSINVLTQWVLILPIKLTA